MTNFVENIDNQQKYDNMEQVKHFTAVENSVKRYTSPRIRVVSVKAQGVLCGSLDGTPSNNPWTSGSESTYGLGDDDE